MADSIIPTPERNVVVLSPASIVAMDEALRQHERIKALAVHISRKWNDLGLELRDFRDHQRWRPLGYPSIDAWIKDVADELGLHRSTFYDVVATVTKLAEVKPEDLRQMPRENAKDLARLPESKRPQFLAAAKEKPNREFRREINTQLVGAAREGSIVVAFRLPQTLSDFIEETLKMYGWQGETESRAEQLEQVFIAAREATAEHPDAQPGETIADAYARITTTGDAR